MHGLINGNAPAGAFPDESLLDYLECDTDNNKASGKVIFRKYNEGEASIEFRDIKAINSTKPFNTIILSYSGYDRFLPISRTILPLLTYTYTGSTAISQSYLTLPERGTNDIIRIDPMSTGLSLLQIPNIIIRYRID